MAYFDRSWYTNWETKFKEKRLEKYMFMLKRQGRALLVYLLVKSKRGRFMLNRGFSSSSKFTGCEFPKAEKKRGVKTYSLEQIFVESGGAVPCK